MSDISNQFVKDTYDYVLQSDIVTGVVYRIGGAIPINPIFSSGATFLSSLRYSDGSEQPGYVLISDGFGNATWSTPFSGGGITTLNTLTPLTQFFDVGINGNDFNISSSGDTHTFNIPDASPTSRGLVTTGTQFFSGVKIFNDSLSSNTIAATSIFSDIFSGNTFYGDGSNLDGIISAITWNLNNEEILFQRNNTTPFTLNITGLTDNYLPLSGGTVIGPTIFQSGITAITISAATYENLPTDVFVTGGTYSSGTTIFTNNTGGTFSITGFQSTDGANSIRFNYCPSNDCEWVYWVGDGLRLFNLTGEDSVGNPIYTDVLENEYEIRRFCCSQLYIYFIDDGTSFSFYLTQSGFDINEFPIYLSTDSRLEIIYNFSFEYWEMYLDTNLIATSDVIDIACEINEWINLVDTYPISQYIPQQGDFLVDFGIGGLFLFRPTGATENGEPVYGWFFNDLVVIEFRFNGSEWEFWVDGSLEETSTGGDQSNPTLADWSFNYFISISEIVQECVWNLSDSGTTIFSSNPTSESLCESLWNDALIYAPQTGDFYFTNGFVFIFIPTGNEVNGFPEYKDYTEQLRIYFDDTENAWVVEQISSSTILLVSTGDQSTPWDATWDDGTFEVGEFEFSQCLSFDNPLITSTTQLSIPVTNIDSINVYPWLKALYDKAEVDRYTCFLQFYKVGDSSNFGIFSVNTSGNLDLTNKFVFDVVNITGNGFWDVKSIYSISWLFNGLSGGTNTDTYVTGGTYSSGTAVFTNNSGGTFSVNGFTQKFTSNVGDDTSSAITITHNFSTRDIQIEVYRNTDPWDTVFCDVERNSIDSIILRFANPPTLNQYRVVITT